MHRAALHLVGLLTRAAALAGFVWQTFAPVSTILPPGLLYPSTQLSWACSGLPVPGVFGTLLPDYLGFAGPLPEGQTSSQAVLALIDMQVVFQQCPPSWAEAALVVAKPSGVKTPVDQAAAPQHGSADWSCAVLQASLKQQQAQQSQLACDSIYGCRLPADQQRGWHRLPGASEQQPARHGCQAALHLSSLSCRSR